VTGWWTAPESCVDEVVADVVCTHVDRSSVVAATVLVARGVRGDGHTPLDGPPDGARAVRFPGQERLTGVHPVTEITALSEIDEVVGIGVPVGPDSRVDTLGFLRPTYQAGRLVLLVEPAAGGVLRPSEIAQPHQCCGGH
jgi:hypothetical protein